MTHKRGKVTKRMCLAAKFPTCHVIASLTQKRCQGVTIHRNLGINIGHSMAKSDVPPPAHEASQEKPRGADPELSLDLGGHRTGWS